LFAFVRPIRLRLENLLDLTSVSPVDAEDA
jgi:hypothetical protein